MKKFVSSITHGRLFSLGAPVFNWPPQYKWKQSGLGRGIPSHHTIPLHSTPRRHLKCRTPCRLKIFLWHGIICSTQIFSQYPWWNKSNYTKIWWWSCQQLIYVIFRHFQEINIKDVITLSDRLTSSLKFHYRTVFRYCDYNMPDMPQVTPIKSFLSCHHFSTC